MLYIVCHQGNANQDNHEIPRHASASGRNPEHGQHGVGEDVKQEELSVIAGGMHGGAAAVGGGVVLPSKAVG